MTDSAAGWKLLLPAGAWDRRPGAHPIAAYSEFMPPPPIGRRAYGGAVDPVPFADGDPFGWQVTEYEETFELRPGLAHLAAELLHALERLGRRDGAHKIGGPKLKDNPFWPEPLLGGGAPAHERYLALLPLALSRTQDDKGRVRWTLFGASEQGPARPFWQGFFSAPGRELPAAEGLAFCRRLVEAVTGEPVRDLLAAGFRILPGGTTAPGERAELGFWDEGPLPSWVAPLTWAEGGLLRGVRCLLTFRPFARLPEAVRNAYLAGELHLLPFPGSLLFWGAAPYRGLARQLPLALQVPLLHPVERSEDPHRLRVPQSGWMHEPHAGEPQPSHHHGPVRNTFRRTHRWARIDRHEDELAVAGSEDRIAHVLFSSAADDLGLYGKPMARNAQLWTADYQLLLDGPRAGRAQLVAAAQRVAQGGTFGYRFLYPAMRVGDHEVYWHRPLAALPAAGPASAAIPATPALPATPATTAGVQLIDGAPLGYLTAYAVEAPDLAHPVELWPRLLARPAHRAAIEELRGGRFHGAAGPREGTAESAEAGAAVTAAAARVHLAPADYAGYRRTVNNARKVLDAWDLLGRRPLPASFARALLRLPRGETLERWLAALDAVAAGLADAAPALTAELRSRVALGGAIPADSAGGEPALTFHVTARRRFEEAYWRRIAFLATGRFVNKDNADVVLDRATRSHLRHQQRDLDALADYLLAYYRRLIAAHEAAGPGAGAGRAEAGDLPFRWQTDFSFDWSGGWLANQGGDLEERNVMMAIPGRDRGRAVIMADHYDTAYMEDRYGYQHGGHGPRLAAAGADDNHSATVALMLAAPIFLEMSRAGRLACDVWLVHLTGEEFPSDCMGARHLAQSLVEGTLRLRTERAAAPRRGAGAGSPLASRWTDLAATRVEGVYVLDMVAHNNDRDRDVFQICPGAGAGSMWLALQAHLANRAWNELVPGWNRRGRRGCRRGRRGPGGPRQAGRPVDPADTTVPATALHPELRGQVRPMIDPRSTLYNTDGQIFSDAGVPVVLFMENYDINRHGYHDSHDTLENIDLDYGAALAAIAIEAVARAATSPPPAG